MVIESAIATTTGAIKDGRLLVRAWSTFAASFQRMRNAEVEIVVMRIGQHRSRLAEKYLWGCVYKYMAAETGHTKEELHVLMCQRFLTRTITLIDKRTGDLLEQQVPGRSSRLTHDEYCRFIDDVRLFAGEFLNLEIPDADPNWRENRQKKAA